MKFCLASEILILEKMLTFTMVRVPTNTLLNKVGQLKIKKMIFFELFPQKHSQAKSLKHF
jgi:hypothetical protein